MGFLAPSTSDDRREPDVEDRRLEPLPGDVGSMLLWWLLSPMERRLVLRLVEALRSVLPSSGEIGCDPLRGTLVADILVDGALRSPVLLRRVPFLGKVAGPGGLLVRRSVSRSPRCLRCRLLLLIRRLLLFNSTSILPLLLSSIMLSCIRLLPFMRELLPFMRELLPFIRLPLLLPPALSLRLLRLLSPLEPETEEECSLADVRDLRGAVSSGKETSAKSLPKESSNSSSSNSEASKGSKAD